MANKHSGSIRNITNLDRTIENCIEFMPVTPKGKIAAKHILRSLRKTDMNWDPWLFKDDGVYRLFYLAASNRSILRPWWKVESKIYGAISTDMKQWQDIGMILDIEPANLWEAGRLFAGCAWKEDGIYYLFYSAAGKDEEFLNEGIGLATSIDGLHWQRNSNHPLIKPDTNNRWYGSYNDHFQWRDPYIVKEPNTGKYYMFIAAHFKEDGITKRFGGCIGLAIADKIAGPYELLPPAAVPFFDDLQESAYYEMERPQIIYKNGKYHLFVSAFVSTLNPKWLQRLNKEKITDSSLYWYTSESITGPFKPESDQPLVRGSETTGMYGTNFFPAPENPEEFIAYGWRHRMFSLELLPLFRVHWEDDAIAIKNLYRKSLFSGSREKIQD